MNIQNRHNMSRIGQTIILLVSFLASTPDITASDIQASDSLLSVVDREKAENLSLSQLFDHVYQNPALTGFKRNHSYSSAGISWSQDRHRDGMPYNPAAGSSEMHGSFMAQTYLKHKQSTLSGFAGYTTGKIKSMEWCETSDYDIVYPYVMADGTGGDLNEEIYRFGGGISSSTGKWHYGASLAYKAGLYYRSVDPRPRNVTGLLNLAAGAGLSIGNYITAIGVTADKYKQTNAIEFMSELGSAKIYHLTGLGTDYSRFAGTGESTYYTGWRYGATFDLHPARNISGLIASLGVTRFTFSNIISDLNKLPLAHVRELEYHAQAGWLGQHAAVNAYASIRRRLGDENIFGDATSGSYPQISTLTMYAHNRIRTGAQASGIICNASRFGLKINAMAEYIHDNQVQSAANARRIINNLDMNINCTVTFRATQATLFSANVGYGHRHPIRSTFNKPKSGIEGAIAAADARFLADSHMLNCIDGTVTMTHALPHQLALHIAAHCTTTTIARNYAVTASIIF